jgi:hypothetical protein
MGQKICFALQCIERSLSIRNRRLGKKPIPIPKISEFSLGTATLERSCREFLDLEYFSKRMKMNQYYALCVSAGDYGRALIFKCSGRGLSLSASLLCMGGLFMEGLGLPKEGLYR